MREYERKCTDYFGKTLSSGTTDKKKKKKENEKKKPLKY